MALFTPENREEAKLLVKEAMAEALKELNQRALFQTVKEEILTVPQAAVFLHCTEDTVRDFAQTGRLKSFKPSKSYFFLKSDLLEWVKAHPKTPLSN